MGRPAALPPMERPRNVAQLRFLHERSDSAADSEDSGRIRLRFFPEEAEPFTPEEHFLAIING